MRYMLQQQIASIHQYFSALANKTLKTHEIPIYVI